MQYARIMVHIQGNSKEFDYIIEYGGKFFGEYINDIALFQIN